MKEKKFDSEQLLRMAYARMTLDQLIETRDKLQQQLAVLDQLIAEQSSPEEVTTQ